MFKWIASLFKSKNNEMEQIKESKPELEIGGEEYTKELIATLKNILTKYDNFERLYFYGSRSLGKNKPNSDYDFYIVFSDEADDIFDGLHLDNPRIRNQILKLLAENGFNHFRMDLMMAKESRFQRLALENSSHVWQILNGKGREV